MTTILVVDDDDQFRTMLSGLLTHAGYQIQQAANGVEALQQYTTQPADLVITDLVMPEKEGLETILGIRRLCPEARIIAMSGGERRGGDQCLKMAEALGAQAVLAKPFDREELLDTVMRVLQNEALPSDHRS